jgi:hypothetical protein
MATQLYIEGGVNDLQDRVGNTICLYKGHPYHVNVVGDRVDLYKMTEYPSCLNRPPVYSVPHTDPDFDWRSPQLGYMNYKGRVWYLTRRAARQFRQGLTAQVIEGSPNRYERNWFYTKSMQDCITGVYPTYQEALEMIKNIPNTTQVAFDRRLALVSAGTGVLHLHHRQRMIGVMYEATNRFFIIPSPDYSFLVKYVKKKGVPV